jgi:hypothetical protein
MLQVPGVLGDTLIGKPINKVQFFFVLEFEVASPFRGV